MKQKLNEKALGYGAAIISAAGMLLMGIAGNLGWYSRAVESMIEWHIFFNLSIGGIFTGMLEAAFWSFIIGWSFAKVYNKFL